METEVKKFVSAYHASFPRLHRRKTEEVAKGLFLIKKVYDNGTALLGKGVTETRVNIRHIFPC
ncbi:Hypothetical protein PHPALM_3754 [Phytophthora palmivora]|uniref:Uncharacterized protein n=1 Tax=Phytophthora palmivora TaxID=4796 RepID=A0A2P4YLS2_9STRA|nr:Hypothetical protein PHPALM_3754 [Phytophthora palmivora]